MVLIDPTNFMMKNVATNAYQIGQIQSTFQEAWQKLSALKDVFEGQIFGKLSPDEKVRKDFLNSYYESGSETYDIPLALEKNSDLLESCLGLKLTE